MAKANLYSDTSGRNGDQRRVGRYSITKRALPTIRYSVVTGHAVKVQLVNVGYLYTLVARHAQIVKKQSASIERLEKSPT